MFSESGFLHIQTPGTISKGHSYKSTGLPYCFFFFSPEERKPENKTKWQEWFPKRCKLINNDLVRREFRYPRSFLLHHGKMNECDLMSERPGELPQPGGNTSSPGTLIPEIHLLTAHLPFPETWHFPVKWKMIKSVQVICIVTSMNLSYPPLKTGSG